MIELRHLSHLLAACEHENLTQAAEDLQVAPSTLSSSLKALETEVGCRLFKRLGSGLYPRTGARWMFRAALPMLLLERHTGRRLRRDGDASLLTIRIDLKFTVGRVSKALLQAIAQTETEEPHLLVHPVWTEDEPAPVDKGWSDVVEFRDVSTLALGMMGSDAVLDPGDVVLLRDPWVLAYRVAGDAGLPPDLAERTVMAPLVSHDVLDAVHAHIIRHGIPRVRMVQDHPGSMPRLMNDHPEAAFLLPQSALSRRLGMINVATTPLRPELTTHLIARTDPTDAAAVRFRERLQQALADPRGASVFSPELTSRRLRYFNLAYRLGSVSAAARLANVAQPALSEQLRKLELTLGTRLFDRRSSGVTPTAESARFAPVAQALENGLGELRIAIKSSLSSQDRRLSLGVLPSVSQHGLLVNRIAEAVLALRAQHPDTRVTVREGPNGTLQDWVSRGDVGLAIVETGPPHLPRLPLDASEGLAVVHHPRHPLLPPGPVPFIELSRLPLALPTAQSGLRQLLDAASRVERVSLRPVMEVDALAMLIALLEHEAVCTVLPASAIRRELASGALCAHPIVAPSVARRLFVIYSGDRSLTAPEREFVTLLRNGLADRPIDSDEAASDRSYAPTPPLTAALH